MLRRARHHVQHDIGEKSRVAFTLAEVLITLTIIGVIAALTIPNLMSKYQEHAWHQQWKDDYSMLNNALKMVISEEPDMIIKTKRTWGISREFVDTFLSKLKVVETCGTNNTWDNNICDNHGSYNLNQVKYKWSGTANVTSKYLSLAGNKLSAYDFGFKNALLKNGASIYFGGSYSGLTILVDVNNYQKGPNVLGKDVYALNLVDIATPGRTGLETHYVELSAKDLAIQPYGSPNKLDRDGLKGCATDIGKHSSVLADEPGAGCGYKYLYEK